MKRVLIVGSEPLMREMMAALLADIAVEIRTVNRIADAEYECRCGAFDLVIMLDLAPFFDGSEPMSLLRPRRLRRPELFVISWQHSERSVLSMFECGVTQYLTFPLNARRLRSKICKTLNCDT